jgi:hypothetical protein
VKEPSFAEIVGCPIPTLRNIPKKVRNDWASVFGGCCNDVVSNPSDVWSYKKLFLLAKCVLRNPRRQELGKSSQDVKCIIHRLRRWRSGDILGLWKEACDTPSSISSDPTDSKGVIFSQVRAAVAEGNFGKACKLLLSNGVSTLSDAVFDALAAKHPARFMAVPEPASLPPATQLSSGEIMRALETFPSCSSAGPSKLWPQNVKDAVRCPSPLHAARATNSLCALVNHLASGNIPSEVAPFIIGAKLIPLAKKDGGIRPIAVGETLRRLVSKGLCSAVKREAADLLLPVQVGVAVRGGCEAAVHSTKAFVHHYRHAKDMCLAKMDFENAFNLMSRKHILEQVQKHFPGLFRWAYLSLRTDGNLLLSEQLSLKSSRGVQQGDPLGPLLFALGLQVIPLKLRQDFPSVFQVWYLDDGLLIGKNNEVVQAISTIASEASKIGMSLNLSKCEVWWPGRKEFNEIPFDVSHVLDEGVEFLGAGVGSLKFIRGLMTRKLSQARVLQKAILQLDDTQMELALLRSCAATCKIMHLLRCHSPFEAIEAAESFDDDIADTLEQICSHPLPQRARQQACLPISRGGLGLISSSDLAPAAFLGSISDTAQITQLLLSPFFESSPPVVPWVRETEDMFGPEDLHFTSQKSLAEKIHGERLQELLSGSSPVEKARLLSVSARRAGAWLLALPSKILGLKLENREFRVLLRMLLGAPIYPTEKRCPVCHAAPLDVNGAHSLVCGTGGDRIWRHDVVKDAIYHMCQAAGLNPRKESHVSSSNDRPGDIFLPCWSLGQPAAFDVSITSPLQPAILLSAAESSHAASGAREAQKMKKYAAMCSQEGVNFVPLVFETFGAVGEAGEEALVRMARAWGDKTGLQAHRAVSFFFQRVSLALQRGNASLLLARSPLCF